ncbi:elongin A, like isoform X2 [Gouania willdenowi]|uniref:elongin A, like isoform X2 n=1 Tax=Gouania willdenowi TaxID=441366 RepID=UPI001054A31D|nr:elongin-A-like isoform X2 [Gouania willdenowi]
MASSADVVKKIVRLKLQLSDTAEPGTVLKILQKLSKLDITIDILAETGIGKTVNSFRRHEEAGEIAKSLVYGWKRLVPSESVSPVVDKGLTEGVPMRDNQWDRSFSDDERLAQDDVNNNSLKVRSKNQDSSEDETECKTPQRKPDKEDKEEKKRKRKENNNKTSEVLQENLGIAQKDVVTKKTENLEDKRDSSVVTKRKKNCQKEEKQGEQECLFGSSEDTRQRSKSDSREKRKGPSESGQFRSERDSKTSQSHSGIHQKKNKESKDPSSCEISDQRLRKGMKQSEAHNEKRRKSDDKPLSLSSKESDDKNQSNHRKAKRKHGSNSDLEKPAMSFESYLNYDETVLKMKERSGSKKSSKKIKTLVKKQKSKDSTVNAIKSPTSSPKKESVMHLMDIPLPAALPECDDLSTMDYFKTKAEKVWSDVCDVSEDSAVFTGQRLNKKMQVYSGAKSTSLPSMMTLYHQCIRTLQNNINLLFETGGVPFEILEPVLERCTPEQLLRIEEFNPIYIGVTDHLWGKHCQRDFKGFKLNEYESWKEMYIRLYEERERKFKRLTKSIVSAHSSKPKGRQVKMAFIHTVAKPPRDVRIKQEIHGTASAPQPHPPRSSGKFQDSQLRATSQQVEPNKSSSSSAGNTQDPRKKTRVAPMMAKSLKAFKKQLQRR